MTDFAHLDAFQQSLHREEERYLRNPSAFRNHCIAMKLKEIEAEKKFLKSIEPDAFAEIEAMTTDELLNELLGGTQ